jgi:putative ABC transport system permease protein
VKYLLLIAKNLRRNRTRSALTAAGTMILVLVVSLVWSILSFLDEATSEKNSNFKAIVTERWRIPSQMPFAYAASLSEGAARRPDDVRPLDSMTWQFYGGTLDPANRTRENSLFAFATEPSKIATMMDELDTLPRDSAEFRELQNVIQKLENNRRGLVLGRERLAALGKQVGDRIKLFSINYQDINLEFEIVGVVPPSRYDRSAFFHRDYLNSAVDAYPLTHRGQKHPLADKSLNLVWLRVPDAATLRKLINQIDSSPEFTNPAVKCETQSSGIATFLEAYRDLVWGMRWLLAPAVIVTLALVISNAISISVRERRLELAVLKVLGFPPISILAMVIGEALLLGVSAGLASAGATYWIVNHWIGGLKFPIAFFPAFFIPASALWWGVAIGGSAALAGSLLPAWSAMRVRVADVFAKVA